MMVKLRIFRLRSIILLAVVFATIFIIVIVSWMRIPEKTLPMTTLNTEVLMDQKGNSVFLKVKNISGEMLPTAELDVMVNGESAWPSWFENKIEVGGEATAILGVCLSEGDKISIFHTSTGSVIHENDVELILIPPPPFFAENMQDVEIIQPTSIGGPVGPGGPPPLVAVVGGTISGLDNSDNAYIMTSAGICFTSLRNGTWWLGLPSEGEYRVSARASGYVSHPESYTFLVSQGDNITSLDFEFSKI